MNDENEMDKNEAYLMGQTSGKLNNTEKKYIFVSEQILKLSVKKRLIGKKISLSYLK